KKEEAAVKAAEEKPSGVEPLEEKVSKSPLYREAENFLKEARTLPQNYFTIQILIACQEETILKLKKEYPDLNFWYIPINFKGRSCYKLFYEKFGSKEEAEKARAGLPSKLLEGKPQIVSFSKALQSSP
ncbi:MAG: SPOR domain-containing protein, partial [Thermoanaerobaculia bacterium]